MAIFTIDSDNNIVAHAELPAGADQSQSFISHKELAKLTAEWPASRLIEIWNSFAGVAPFDDLKPVKKFTSRKAAVSRIWQAVARLSPDVAPPAADVRRPRERGRSPQPRRRGAHRRKRAQLNRPVTRRRRLSR